MTVEHDVVVLGTGCAGLVAALAAIDAGADVGLYEKAESIGGTTATSGGIVWVPNNQVAAAAGVSDSREDGLAYLGSLSHGLIDLDRAAILVDTGPEMLTFVEADDAPALAARRRLPRLPPRAPWREARWRAVARARALLVPRARRVGGDGGRQRHAQAAAPRRDAPRRWHRHHRPRHPRRPPEPRRAGLGAGPRRWPAQGRPRQGLRAGHRGQGDGPARRGRPGGRGPVLPHPRGPRRGAPRASPARRDHRHRRLRVGRVDGASTSCVAR